MRIPVFCTFNVMSPGTGDGSVRDWDHSGIGLDRYVNTVFQAGFVPTLFVSGECARAHAPMLDEYRDRGAEIGLFAAPSTTLDAKKSTQMGMLGYADQDRIVQAGLEQFQRYLGYRPTALRTGLYSANDDTYRVAAAHFFTHICVRLPGAALPVIGTVWPVEQQIMSREGLIDIPVTTKPDEKLFNRFPLYFAADVGAAPQHVVLLQAGMHHGHVCLTGGTQADYWDVDGTSLPNLIAILRNLYAATGTYAACVSEFRTVH